MKLKLKLILIVALIALSLSLFACTSKQVSLKISCDDFMEDRYFTWDVEVNAGDSINVTLCSNPSTGFLWSELAQISNETVLNR
jgi:ABC-type oligopeptide transport system substrate-binding subunit